LLKTSRSKYLIHIQGQNKLKQCRNKDRMGQPGQKLSTATGKVWKVVLSMGGEQISGYDMDSLTVDHSG
jgi:hypothetical protein